jgi:hypothetical protein
MRLIGTLIFGVVTGLAISQFGPALDWTATGNAAVPAGGRMQWVDRAHKGDRLDIGTTRVGKEPVPPPKLLAGCEPAASPLSRLRAAVPGRCTA